MINKTIISKVGKLIIPDPEFGDFKLSVYPIQNNGEWVKLPMGYEFWENSLNELLKQIPQCEGANEHYVTIDSRFFTKPDFLRREGVHADGNFCVDPNFKGATWGGTQTSWGGAKIKDGEYVAKQDNSHVTMDWVLPYKIVIPVGDYISSKKGGIFTISTEVGCQGWDGEFYGEVGSEGDFSTMKDQLTDDKKIVFEKDTLYFMTSNTPHETLIVDKGKRRTFMRITLNHEYPNEILPCMKMLENATK